MNALYISTAVILLLFLGFIVEQIILYTVLYSLYRKFVPIRCAGGMDEAVPQAF